MKMTARIIVRFQTDEDRDAFRRELKAHVESLKQTPLDDQDPLDAKLLRCRFSMFARNQVCFHCPTAEHALAVADFLCAF